jgi:hypothetical protein
MLRKRKKHVVPGGEIEMTETDEGQSEFPSVSDEASEKLKQQLIMIDIFQKNQREELMAHQMDMASHGTLDSYNAGRLGIHIDVYKYMKDDARVHQCLDQLDDVYLRSRYSQEEQTYDAITFGMNVPELIKQRYEELVRLQKQIRKNAGALEIEYRKKIKGLPKLTAKQLKAIRDADLTTFIPMDTSLRINREEIKSATEQQKVSKETEAMVQIAKQKDKYYELLAFRTDVRKIINAEIQLAENHEGMSRFHIKLTREGNFTDERKNATVKSFGWTELREIGLSFKGKPFTDMSSDAKAFLKRIEKVWKVKQQMETALGLRSGESLPSSPTSKRKATEDAPGQTSKRRA